MTFLLLYLGTGFGFAALCMDRQDREDAAPLLSLCLIFWLPIVFYAVGVATCVWLGLTIAEMRRPK